MRMVTLVPTARRALVPRIAGGIGGSATTARTDAMVGRDPYLAAGGAEALRSLPMFRGDQIVGVVFAVDAPGRPPAWLPNAVDHGLAHTGGCDAKDAIVIMCHSSRHAACSSAPNSVPSD